MGLWFDDARLGTPGEGLGREPEPRGPPGPDVFRPFEIRVQRAGIEALLDESIRAAVQFDERNLAGEDGELWQIDSYDVVFFRNVLMYFTPEAAIAAVERVSRALVLGGYLFLGHAETLRGLSTGFHLRHTNGTFYYQRREPLGRREDLAARAAAPVASLEPPAGVAGGSEGRV